MNLNKGIFFIAFSLLLLVCSCGNEDNYLLTDNSDNNKLTTGNSFLSYYVSVGAESYYPVDTTNTEYTIFVPFGTDVTALKPVFLDNSKTVMTNEQEQISGESIVDFSNYKTGVEYIPTSEDGEEKKYTVRVLPTKLPYISITTNEGKQITDKENWKEAYYTVWDQNGKIESSGNTGIKGRGNYTWLYYPKKPYALKFDNKVSVLGMPAHKRWTLLALWTGVIGTPIMFEASRRAPAIEWTPRGRYVEVVLNGKYQGLYYLCEQTKIDKNRVNIQSLKATDTEYPNVSGGYLLEYDNQFDEKYQFYSQGFNLPVMLKSPDDNVPLEQYEYIRNYINELEVELLKIGTDTESHYADYIDIDNFVDYWITLEVLWNYEARKPRSLKMYKGRDGVDSPQNTVCKLKAGPLWDLEVLYCDQSFNTKDAHYYGALFKDSLFIERVKQRWPKFRDDLLGLTNNKSIVEYINDVVDEIEFSSKRDLDYWGDMYFSFDTDVETVRNGFDAKIKWMDAEINKLEVIQ